MKTTELSGAALDWAVLKCECDRPAPFKSIPVVLNGTVRIFRGDRDLHSDAISPSTDWTYGGPIIEREGILVVCWTLRPVSVWMARLWLEPNGRVSVAFKASTPLVAAMRCYVSLTLGDDVDIPSELL